MSPETLVGRDVRRHMQHDELDRRVPCGDTRPLNSETQSNAQVGEVV